LCIQPVLSFQSRLNKLRSIFTESCSAALASTFSPVPTRLKYDSCQKMFFRDGKSVGLSIEYEKYGLFSRYMSTAGRTSHNSLDKSGKRKQGLVPDLVTTNHPATSPIVAPGLQMWELKLVHGICKFSQAGESRGLNCWYNTYVTRKPADKREGVIPKGYEQKAKSADIDFGVPGQTKIFDALKAMTQVRGLVIGAVGEMSGGIYTLIEGMAHEGSLKNPEMFGSSNPVKAKNTIAWWLKKRWSRLAVIATVQCREDAMCYVGGSSQHAAAARHFARGRNTDWGYDNERVAREFQASRNFS
jgi:hypothetical protein